MYSKSVYFPRKARTIDVNVVSPDWQMFLHWPGQTKHFKGIYLNLTCDICSNMMDNKYQEYFFRKIYKPLVASYLALTFTVNKIEKICYILKIKHTD